MNGVTGQTWGTFQERRKLRHPCRTPESNGGRASKDPGRRFVEDSFWFLRHDYPFRPMVWIGTSGKNLWT